MTPKLLVSEVLLLYKVNLFIFPQQIWAEQYLNAILMLAIMLIKKLKRLLRNCWGCKEKSLDFLWLRKMLQHSKTWIAAQWKIESIRNCRKSWDNVWGACWMQLTVLWTAFNDIDCLHRSFTRIWFNQNQKKLFMVYSQIFILLVYHKILFFFKYFCKIKLVYCES